MSVLFVSHFCQDDAGASVLERWLHVNGFTEVFVDHDSIAGGENWSEVLRASAGACRLVVCLISESWLRSSECFNEFLAAWYMGKRVMPLLLLSQPENLDEE